MLMGRRLRVRKAALTATDTTPPTAPVLTGATGAGGAVDLSWTAATDASGIDRYEVWMDTGAYLTGLTPGTLSFTAAGLTPGSSHTFRVVAYDYAGNPANSNTVTASAGATSSPFPRRLSTSGRTLVDEDGHTMPVLRGFNMHVFTGAWSQAELSADAALDTRTSPGRLARVVIHWDAIQPTNGTSVDSAFIAALDLTIARLIATETYIELEVHLNVGRIPSWAQSGLDETDRFCKAGSNNGQFVTEYLAKRYGDPTDPLGAGKYTKAVVGFELNEPPVNGTTMNSAAGSVPYLEAHQGRVFGWMRTYAPAWIGFMAWSYASGTPTYTGPGEDTSKTDADPAAACYVNGVIVLHDYLWRVNTESSTASGRQFNGSIYGVPNGGPMVNGGDEATYVSSATHRQQHLNFIAPYKAWCIANSKPLMIGEWGWPSVTNASASGGAGQSTVGEAVYINDKQLAWADCSPVAEMHWNRDTTTNTGVNPWASRPGGTYRPSVLDWMAG